MSQRSLELRRDRASLIAKARDLLEQAAKRAIGQRSLNTDEERQYDAHMADVDKYDKDIAREERLSDLEGDLQEGSGRENRASPGAGAPARNDVESRAYKRFLTAGSRSLTADEGRALQADSDTAGGYLVMPREQSGQLLKAVDDQTFVRKLATVEKLSKAESLGVASLDADPEDGDWTTEIKAAGQDSQMKFGGRELKPNPLVKLIKVSKKLIALGRDTEGLVRNRLAYKFAVTEEKGFLTGNGVGRPLGVFVPSAHGISTGRDVSTGNTATGMTVDGLLEAKYSLKSQYHAKAQWIFHRDGVKQLAKLKDDENQYLWQPSVRESTPDRMLNFPVNMSEFAPNTFTASQYVGILGDFSFYWIVDVDQIGIQRLDELYAETRQIGFVAEAHCDGQPVLEEAFARVKLAAS